MPIFHGHMLFITNVSIFIYSCLFTRDQTLANGGLFLVIVHACLYIYYVSNILLSESASSVTGVIPPIGACFVNNGSGVVYVWRVILSVLSELLNYVLHENTYTT